jgi:hypothetical protein
MQRLFSMFPSGLPGIGLLFLRCSVAIALFAENYWHRQGLPGWLQGIVMVLAAPLFAGYLTPIAAAIGLLLHTLIWWRTGGGSVAVTIIVSFDAFALALLGPGVYSVDGARFGRRVIVLPPR